MDLACLDSSLHVSVNGIFPLYLDIYISQNIMEKIQFRKLNFFEMSEYFNPTTSEMPPILRIRSR